MKFSDQWLRTWVEPGVSADALAERLTMAGLEVEAVTPAAPAFSGVVVGEVLRVERHPTAERLTVCLVDAGGEPLTIVCGAHNVEPGLRVPTARVGARLPNGVKIKQATLRGVASNGMLCSAPELGLAETGAGLMILPLDAVPGTDLREYLQLDDAIIELSLTPNRGDCLSIAGIAREVCALTGAALKGPVLDEVPPQSSATLPVSVAESGACPRYLGRVIEGIDVSIESPLWMRERLRRSGLRSLHPVVDVTNYVLIELGQPMHAFDLAKLRGGIHVRLAKEGEPLILLDGQHIELEAKSLLIADDAGPVALAGIMGGLHSAVSERTEGVFLESAFFAPEAIAGQARGYGLHTDSSQRFERGVDPELPRRALERATTLLLEIVGGRAGPVIEVSDLPRLPQRPDITLRRERIGRMLGITLDDPEVETILTRLGLRCEANSVGWSVRAPSARFDLVCEADLIEELARVWGYAAIPRRHPEAPVCVTSDPRAGLEEAVTSQLVARGYYEAITYSFVDPAIEFLFDPDLVAVNLANPISSDMAAMRTTLWPGLVTALVRNQKRQQTRVRLFELGPKYVPQDNEIKEHKVIGGVVSGGAYPEQWGEPTRSVDFFDVKADVEALLQCLTGGDPCDFEASPHPALHPGQSARISQRGGSHLGWLGALHPRLADRLEVTPPAYVFELDLSNLMPATLNRYRGLSRYPAIRRDLAIVVARELPAQQVCDAVRAAAGKLLRHLVVFDVYAGKGVDSGRKSLALGLTLQDFSRTLTDEMVESILARVLDEVSRRFGATLRE